MASLHPGDLLSRRYRLIDQIGSGGMSVIWRARDEVLDRVVAVKVLAASLAADAKFREMVREEARAAAQLVHPHVTAVHDYGETVAPDGTVTAFVVMELLAGEELEARLTAGPLHWRAAVEIGAQVAEALAAAHRLGIVHRDITPSNIMMTGVGAKLLDFGIATHIGAPDEDEDGETFGTPAYVAPERLDGTPAQPATDTYSLGVLLYQTLTGRVPFPAETWDELTRALQVGTVPTLTGVPDLPPVVAEVCLRCLARDPADRPTAAQVGHLLRGQLLPVDQGGAGPPAPRPAFATPAGSVDPADPTHGGATGGPRQHRVRVVALAAAALVLLSAAVLIGSTLGDGPGSHPQGWPSPVGPGAVSAPAPPSGASPPPSGATASPPPTGPPVVTPTTGRSPAAAPPTVGEVVAQLHQLIEAGVADGVIRDDAGLDLRNHLRNLQVALVSGPVDLAGPVAQMREKVAVRVNEGSIGQGYAAHLDAALVQLATAL